MIGLSIRRPVAVAMAYFAVALLGTTAWRNIPIELLPDTRLPRLTVTGTWRGASPETIEAFLTSPIEATIQQVRGVEKIISESREEQGIGLAEIEVHFNRDTDMDFARLDMSERLSTPEEDLPPGVDRITVQPYIPPEFESQGKRAFLRYTFTGPYTLEALRRHLDELIVPEISQLVGVALVQVSGGRDRLVELELDDDRIGALGLSPIVVAQRIDDLDLVREAGAVRTGDQEWTVTIQNRPSGVQDIREAVLMDEAGSVVRVSDVAVVRDTYEEARSYYRIDGRPAVSFVVTKEIGANTVRIADGVKARLAELERLSPAGTQVILDDDESEEIREQLTGPEGEGPRLGARDLRRATPLPPLVPVGRGDLRDNRVLGADLPEPDLLRWADAQLAHADGPRHGIRAHRRQFHRRARERVPSLAGRGRARGGGGGGLEAGRSPDPRVDGHHAHRLRSIRVSPGRAAGLLRAARNRRRAHAGGFALRRVHVHSGAGGPRATAIPVGITGWPRLAGTWPRFPASRPRLAARLAPVPGPLSTMASSIVVASSTCASTLFSWDSPCATCGWR